MIIQVSTKAEKRNEAFHFQFNVYSVESIIINIMLCAQGNATVSFIPVDINETYNYVKERQNSDRNTFLF